MLKIKYRNNGQVWNYDSNGERIPKERLVARLLALASGGVALLFLLAALALLGLVATATAAFTVAVFGTVAAIAVLLLIALGITLF